MWQEPCNWSSSKDLEQKCVSPPAELIKFQMSGCSSLSAIWLHLRSDRDEELDCSKEETWIPSHCLRRQLPRRASWPGASTPSQCAWRINFYSVLYYWDVGLLIIAARVNYPNLHSQQPQKGLKGGQDLLVTYVRTTHITRNLGI